MALLIDTARRTDAATVIVTHDPEVAKLCDITVALRAGTLVAGSVL